jgi:hypothetical protein
MLNEPRQESRLPSMFHISDRRLRKTYRLPRVNAKLTTLPRFSFPPDSVGLGLPPLASSSALEYALPRRYEQDLARFWVRILPGDACEQFLLPKRTHTRAYILRYSMPRPSPSKRCDIVLGQSSAGVSALPFVIPVYPY